MSRPDPGDPRGDRSQPAITIRRGVEADAAALADLAARTFAETFAADNTPADLAAHLARSYGEALQAAELADPDRVTLVAETGGALVAYAQLRSSTAPACVPAGPSIELQRFYLDRAAQGSGLARRLMDAAIDAARRRGARLLWLGVWERNPRAIRFYEKCGFADAGSQTFLFGSDPQTDRVMWRAVPDRGTDPSGPGTDPKA
jgi:ribosomal protein S18 acetylase RimI-like enzyme